jgi:hypothetical protein
MPIPTQPPLGPVRLTSIPPWPETSVRAIVEPEGLRTTFGLLPWDAGLSAYTDGTITVRFLDNGTFAALNGPTNTSGGLWAPA